MDVDLAPSWPGLGLAEAAEDEASKSLRYDPAYIEISYPGGDVAKDTGVCTDLVIRALRAPEIGRDLQALVHEDMQSSFADYPSRELWGLEAPNTHIDHRRVPNLMVFLARHGRALPLSDNPQDYEAGEIITWDIGRGMTHIGIIAKQRDPESGRPLIAHHYSGPAGRRRPSLSLEDDRSLPLS